MAGYVASLFGQWDIVYRVQDRDGIGPYFGGGESYNLLDHNGDVNFHPSPRRDKKIQRSVRDNELCGFESLKSLSQWFTSEELDALYKIGFYIVRCKGQITAKGEKQVLFVPQKCNFQKKIFLDIPITE